MPRRGKKKRPNPKDESDNSDDEDFKEPVVRPTRSRAIQNPANVGASSSAGKAPLITGARNVVQGDSSDEDENMKRAIELSIRDSGSFQEEEDDEDLKKAMELSMMEEVNLPMVKLRGTIIEDDDDDDLKEALRRSLVEISDTSASDSVMVMDESTESRNSPKPSTSTSVISIPDTPKEVPPINKESNLNAESSEDDDQPTRSNQESMSVSFKPSKTSSVKPPHDVASFDLTTKSPDRKYQDNVDLTDLTSPPPGQSVIISDDEFDFMCNTGSVMQRLSDPFASTPYQKGEPSKLSKPKSDAFLENSFDDKKDVKPKLVKDVAIPDIQPLDSNNFKNANPKIEQIKPKSDAFLESSFDDYLKDKKPDMSKVLAPTKNPPLVQNDKASVQGPSGSNKFRNTTRFENSTSSKGEKSKNSNEGKGLSKKKMEGIDQVDRDGASRTPTPTPLWGSRTPSPDSTQGNRIVAAGNPYDGGSPEAALNPQQATQRMRNVFQKGLDIHLKGEEMQACRAIETELFPHQRTALAWMFAHEQKKNDGLRGGVLADDMGLGKTLTVISLIVTNHHDGRPLVKPELGYTRPAPIAGGGRGKGRGKGRGRAQASNVNVDNLGIGKKIGKSSTSNSDTKKSATKIFGKFSEDNQDSEVENRNPAFRFSHGPKKFFSGGKGASKNVFESSSSEDEFDVMSKNQSSLSSKWSVTSLEETFKGAEDPRDKILDELDDDEEFNAMSHEEKMEAMKPTAFVDGTFDDSDLSDNCDIKLNPTLNVDGGMSFDSDSDDEAPKKGSKKKRPRMVDSESDEEGSISNKKIASKRKKDNNSDDDLPEIRAETPESEYSLDGDESEYLPEESDGSQPNTPNTPHNKTARKEKTQNKKPLNIPNVSAQPPSQNGEPGGTTPTVPPKLIIPPKQPADRNGRRRPTLIVCPTSLIDHWNQQIHQHLNKSVNIRVKIHHGTSKALTGADLDTQDIVITTYGTMAAEFRSQDMSPLMRAKWLRVVLDEGHYIKNNRSLSAKGAHNLDTERRWVVTGTPIQNNLMELWSLVNWLDFGLYADNQNAFKRQIEKPCKNRDPIGFDRLQVLLDTICLRRTKTDKRSDGTPIVDLPKKSVLVRQVDFTAEEKLFYTAFMKKSAEIVEKYRRRGDLMRNYAHIFALMTRLRQFCCHPELVPVNWGMARKDKKALEAMLEQETQGEDNMAPNSDGKDDTNDQESQLAKQLREMIKSGVTDDCSICLDDLNTPVITPCAHVFCRMCIEQVLDNIKPPSCPLCRRELKKAELLEAGNDEDVETDVDDATLKALEDIIVEVSSSKVNAMLREMLRIRRDCPGDKIIITSQFTSFLSIIQPLLRENEFSYTRLDGSMNHRDRAMVINDFQNVDDPSSPQVLLLSLRAGGVGLNLTAANHLMLLDPAWNPATEWQCFDRCHRLGQTKDVTIYKFITKDSIEEKMVDIQAKKTELISGAFQNTPEEARRQRINDIMNIFGI